MDSIDIQTLVASRLEDIAKRVWELHSQGNFRDAELLRGEGLALAEAFDDEVSFMFLPDCKTL